MRIKIAHDARPQVRTLLFAAALTVLLWFVPFAELLTYPFRIFVTFIHEGGHALAAILTGNSVHSLSVAMNGSGEVYSTTGGLLSQLFVSSAGYLGAMAFGALLLILIRRTVAARFVLIASAGLILVLTAAYGFFSPLLHASLPSLFTLVAGVMLPIGLIAAARFAPPRVATFLVSFLAVQCVLNALFDLKTVLFLSSPLAMGVHTDAANMAAATGIPAFFWALVWVGIAFAILSMSLRAYAVSKNKPSQPDLPFEDPLEV
ncbi:MAG: M50 family metallopeptidase [Pyrinomonadaceae bacterium]|nr:M50 family metallopeptidase [Pyrinomonadaceae bacterium]